MKRKILISCAFLISLIANATHNRSGEILYKRVAPFTNVVGSTTVQVYTYSITVIKYMDHGSSVADRCQDTVYFGDGQKGVAQRINGIVSSTCNCGSNPCGEIILNASGYIVKKNVYSVIHTYSGPGTYLIKSIDPFRSSGIHNIPNSGNIPFYIESQMYINANLGMNSSPVFSNPPTDRALNGNCLEINTCAFDADGDSLSYELSTCKDENGQTISGYFLPETGTGGNFSINSSTGLLTWCTPQFVDDYNIAIIVKEWRKTTCNGNYQLLGFVFRDFQVIVLSGPPATFSTSTLSDICVNAGSNAVKGFTVNSTGVQTEVFGETKFAITNSSQINPISVSGNTIVTFSWLTNCSQARKQPYDVYLVFNSNGVSPQKFYRQFKVTVLPPPPIIASVVVDTGKVTINWSNICLTNGAGYNIYRKTGINTWVPGSCEQGVSNSSGFILVGTAPSTATSFTDTNVWPILNGTTAHYVVTAFTNDCAESKADNTQTVTLLVGINENKIPEKFSVFPNPFHDKIEINFDTFIEEPIEVKVVSVDGKMIPIEMISRTAGKWEISTKNFSSGIYMLQIKSRSGMITKKLVKE